MAKQSDIAFLMMKEWREQLSLLNDEQRGRLLTAIYDFQCDGVDFETDDAILKMLWVSIKQVFAINNKKYETVCQINKENARKRWSEKNATACDRIFSDAKNADIDIEKDIDTDKDMVIDFEVDTETGTEADKDCSAAFSAAYAEFNKIIHEDNYQSEFMQEVDSVYRITNGEICALYDLIGEEYGEIYFDKLERYKPRDVVKTVIRWAVEDGVISRIES